MSEAKERFKDLPLKRNQLIGRIDGLSSREHDVLECLIKGGTSNNVIAKELQLSSRTIDTHLGNMYRKLDVVDRVQLLLVVCSLRVISFGDLGVDNTDLASEG